MHQYKIGDKVRIKKGLNKDNCRHWVDALALHSGDIVTIIDVDDEGIFCKENSWFWAFEAFEEVETELRKGEVSMKKSELQHLDIVVTRDGTPHYYFSDVKRLVAEDGFLQLDDYNEDLDQGGLDPAPGFDIVEVHRMEHPRLDTLNVREALSIYPTTLLWKRVEMEKGDNFYYINSQLQVVEAIYTGASYQTAIIHNVGVFTTREEAAATLGCACL